MPLLMNSMFQLSSARARYADPGRTSMSESSSRSRSCSACVASRRSSMFWTAGYSEMSRLGLLSE